MPAWLNIDTYKKFSIAATAVATGIGAAFAVAHAMEVAKPFWLVTYSQLDYVLDQRLTPIQTSQNAIGSRQVRTELEILRSRREQIKSKIEDRQLLLKQDGPSQYQQLVREQIEQFQDQLKAIESQIDDRQRELSGRRP